jgi:hypothetical protein
MLDGYLPITNPLYKNFKKSALVYRIAGENSPSNIKKNENKKTLWSGFTKGSIGIAKGIYSGNTYLYEIEGDILLESELDFYTKLDRNGNKWFYSKTDNFIKFQDEIIKKIEKYLNSEGKEKEQDTWMYLNSRKLDQKVKAERKRKFIKWYYDTVKKIITKPFISKIINDINKSRNIVGDYTNDEVIFNNYKVKGAYIVTNFAEFTDDIIKNYALFEEPDPFGEYINALEKIPFLGFIFDQNIIKIDTEKKKYASDFAFNDYDKVKEKISAAIQSKSYL